jgi:hypothetical protein
MGSAVRDPGAVKTPNLLPEVLQELVPHLAAGRVLERLDVRPGGDNERVAIRRESRCDDLRHADADLRGHQRRQCLVLDLLEAPDRDTSRWIAICERTPAPGHALGVLRVATEDAHSQWAAARIMSDVLGRTDALPDGCPQLGDFDPERLESEPNRLGRREARGRSERQPHECCGPETQRQGAQESRREGRAQRNCAECCRDDEPPGEDANRTDELGSCDREDRRHAGDAQLGEPPPRPEVCLDHEPVRLHKATEDEPYSDHEEQRHEQVARESPTAAHENVNDDHKGKNQCGHEGDPPERLGPPENRDERLGGLLVDRSRRGGDDGREAGEERPHDQTHRVDRASMPPSRLGGRQEREIPGPFGICQSDTRRCDCRSAVVGRQDRQGEGDRSGGLVVEERVDVVGELLVVLVEEAVTRVRVDP